MFKHIRKLLIANRGEVAIRIARAADELEMATVAVFAEDDAGCLHVRKADAARALRGVGAAAYLDVEQLLTVAKESGCDAVHPGYGFLSESAAFAQACSDAGLVFVGPTAEQLALLGDKLRARALALSLDIPVAQGSSLLRDVAEARAFLSALKGPALLKAAHGGGGRGMRVIRDARALDAAFQSCQREAEAAFGNGALYMEELLEKPRHIEVQVVGDQRGGLIHLGERDCSLQRRHQKLVELAPSPVLSDALRAQLCSASLRMASQVKLQSLATFEFLTTQDEARFVFIEANPRLQVEHTVSEQVWSVDLVKTQLEVARGKALTELGLSQERLAARGFSIQLRVNLEELRADGSVLPASGVVRAFEAPSGAGVRVDGCAYAGYEPSGSFDSLLLKLIVHTPEPSFATAVRKARRALSELRLDGVATNQTFLAKLLDDEAFAAGAVHTTFLEEEAARFASADDVRRLVSAGPMEVPRASAEPPPPAGLVAVVSPVTGRVLSLDANAGDQVTAGQPLAVIEAMKMESVVLAPAAGVVRTLRASRNANVRAGSALFWLEPIDAQRQQAHDDETKREATRADLSEVLSRRASLLDEQRPEAVAKRRKTGQRTARENVAALCDAGTFFEYGGFALAAQRSTRSMSNLLEVSPADGVITGIGQVNGTLFGSQAARCMVVAYDYTVFAGTQGLINHKKQDRMFELAARERLPIVLFAEGGGGRPGDTDQPVRPTLDVPTFRNFAALSGRVPLVGVVSGRCFAGNAALLGCCDVIIATEDSSIGMGGPVMIEGAGLGKFAPEQVGPVDVQSKNGVVDVRVADEQEAARIAKQYLSYFQGSLDHHEEPDVQTLRTLVPDNRRRLYPMREALTRIADVGSVLELRREFGVGMITALARIQGRPVGIFANDPSHLAGAIDAAAADKAARFMRLCDAYGIPLISLCDTPGFMVGPEVEQTAQVRHVSRMMLTAAQLEVPLFCVVLRKAYGLGAMAMAGGHMHAPLFTIAWPTGEFGAMGLEGAVQLAFRKQLQAIADPVQRESVMRQMAEGLRLEGRALNIASHIEIDDVIDPADTRARLVQGLAASVTRAPSAGSRPRFIDSW